METPIFKIKETPKGIHFIFTVPGEPAEGQSENYTSKLMCERGVASVKENCQDDLNYELIKARNGQLYFNLKAQNGEVIYTSIMHNDNTSRENAIVQLKQFGKDAEVVFVPKEKIFIKHVVMDMDKNDQMQGCIMCGKLITDYRNVSFPAGDSRPNGFPAGDVFVLEGNPETFSTYLNEGETAVDCH